MVGSEDPLWNLFVVRMPHEDKFLFVQSLDHSVGDGSTEYRIYEMLSENKDIVALDHRPVDSIENIKTNLLVQAESLYSGSAGILMGLLRRLLSASLGLGGL
jgi:hypothetical protein